jgi:hypothetical protein
MLAFLFGSGCPLATPPWLRLILVVLLIVFAGTLHAAIGPISNCTTDDGRADARLVAAIVVVGCIRVTVTTVYEQKVSVPGPGFRRLSFLTETKPKWRR